MYGTLVLWSKKKGVLGRLMIGWTVGEEAVLDSKYICRFENCYSENDAAVLEISLSRL